MKIPIAEAEDFRLLQQTQQGNTRKEGYEPRPQGLMTAPTPMQGLYFTNIILSHASEAGSPTNRPGSDKTQGQGSFGPSTGEPDNHLDKKF